jgi:hypothetical protein
MGLSKETYAERRRLGLCVQCGEQSAGKSKCSKCAGLDKDARDQRRKDRKSRGLCTECGNKAEAGYALCPGCIAKQAAPSQKRYYRNKEAGGCRVCGEKTEAGKARCPVHAEEFRIYQNERVAKKRDAGICLFCPDPARSGLKTCLKCAERIAERQRQDRKDLQNEVFDAYGGPKCRRCGFDKDPDSLQIDHIEGGGTKHLKEIGRSKLYSWLKKNGYPPGYRVLCANCNFALGKVGRPKKL